MMVSNRAPALFLIGALLTTSACGGSTAVPTGHADAVGSAVRFSTASGHVASPEDTTSILKKLKKDVVIGSTVDPKNHDKGPRGVAVVRSSYKGLKKGQVLVCNFSDSSGGAGKGTTVEKLDPTPGSKPATFVQNSKIEGCSDDSISSASDDLYVTGFTSKVAAQLTPGGRLGHTWGKPLVTPFSILDAACTGVSRCLYAAEPLFISDAKTGGIVSFSVNGSGNPIPTEVIAGFAVDKKDGWSALGPSGLAFTSAKQGTLYVADGPDNTIVSVNHAAELLVKDEIVVEKGGKTFKCKYPKTSCGKLIKAGKPLDEPEAMTLLPNGNLVVANTHGNTLVELTTSGQVLDTKVVDKSKTAGIFGLYAIGSNDANTAIFYTDTNDNSLHELEQ